MKRNPSVTWDRHSQCRHRGHRPRLVPTLPKLLGRQVSAAAPLSPRFPSWVVIYLPPTCASSPGFSCVNPPPPGYPGKLGFFLLADVCLGSTSPNFRRRMSVGVQGDVHTALGTVAEPLLSLRALRSVQWDDTMVGTWRRGHSGERRLGANGEVVTGQPGYSRHCQRIGLPAHTWVLHPLHPACVCKGAAISHTLLHAFHREVYRRDMRKRGRRHRLQTLVSLWRLKSRPASSWGIHWTPLSVSLSACERRALST